MYLEFDDWKIDDLFLRVGQSVIKLCVALRLALLFSYRNLDILDWVCCTSSMKTKQASPSLSRSPLVQPQTF